MPPKKEENSCGKCGKVVKEGIQCEICEVWWHPACSGIDKELCESLGKSQQLHWYCVNCNLGVDKLIKEVMKIRNRLEDVEDCVKKMNDKVEKLREGFNTQLDNVILEVNRTKNERLKESDVKQLIAEELRKFEDKDCELKPIWSEIITKEVGNRFSEITNDIDSVQKSVTETKEKILDNEDKLKRKNNIIMYNVEESKSGTVAGRNDDDMKFCGSVMEEVLKVGYEKGDIVKVVRLGKFDDSKKRPLLIEFTNAHVKNVVMENVTKLGTAKDNYKGVTISHDMTIKEREQCRMLVEEAKKKEKEDTGNFIYRVRGLPGQMKIVRCHKAETDVKKIA